MSMGEVGRFLKWRLCDSSIDIIWLNLLVFSYQKFHLISARKMLLLTDINLR